MHIARGSRLGYLRQEAVDAFADRSNTVYAEMLTVFADLQAQQARLHELEAQMAAGDHQRRAAGSSTATCRQLLSMPAAMIIDLRIQQTLEGLGLGKKHWHMPLSHLSGGQKTRALLARLLLEKPDLLMLDEPTNHLDIEAVEWLERTLREWEGAVLIVSHDRYFLDNTVNTIWEMTRSGIEVYSGNYSAYLLQRQERWEYYERVFKEEKDPPAERGGFHPAQLGARQHACPRAGPAAPPDAATWPSSSTTASWRCAAARNGPRSDLQRRAPAGCDRGDPQGQRHPHDLPAARRASARAWPQTHTSGNIVLRADERHGRLPRQPALHTSTSWSCAAASAPR